MFHVKLTGLQVTLLLYATVDLLMTTLFVYNADETFSRGVAAVLLSYAFLTGIVDFMVLALLRISILGGALIGIWINPVDGPPRLRRCSFIFTSLSLIMMIFSPLKLLCLDEKPLTNVNWPWFWALFCWNIFSSAIFAFFISTILARLVPNFAKRNSRSAEVVQDVAATDLSNLVKDQKLQSEANVHVLKPEQSFHIDPSDLRDTYENMQIKQSSTLLLRMFKYCCTEWVWYGGGTLFLLLYSITRVFIPYFTGEVVAQIVSSASSEHIFRSVRIMTLLSLASAIFAGFRAGFFEYTFIKVNLLIRADLFAALMRQEIGFFDSASTGNIMSRISADCQCLSDLVSYNMNVFMRNSVMMIGSLMVMVSLSWQMTIMNAIALPMIVLISKCYGSYFEKLAERTQKALADSCDVAEEVISNMRTVKCFANEEGERKRFRDKVRSILGIYRRKALALIGYTWINELFSLVVLVTVLWYGGHLVMIGHLDSKNLIAYLLYQLQLGEALLNISNVYTGLRQAVGAAKKVFELIDRKPKIGQNGLYSPPSPAGLVEFKHVSFAYPTRPDQLVLKDISFTVNPGETVALVGPSGGGKSSCISLLEHFYEPLAGEILLDGVPVQHYEHGVLHNVIALVNQEPVLFARTLRENIAYGLESSSVDSQEVVAAAVLANAHSFVSNFPQGYSTEAGEKGVQLSGGQKQRLAIARALIRRPTVLLLDEATSALDAESEFLVQEAIYNNLHGRTVLLIAHRLSTVERADRIIVINNGQVVQQGSHVDLLAEGGLYKCLVERQLRPGNKKA